MEWRRFVTYLWNDPRRFHTSPKQIYSWLVQRYTPYGAECSRLLCTYLLVARVVTSTTSQVGSALSVTECVSAGNCILYCV